MDLNLKVFQKGFNYSQDGPGNRLVYHLQGCNMRCPWCANPESFTKNGTLMVYEEWLVDSVCPFGAIERKSLDRVKCGSCSKRTCVEVNKNKGIQHSCKEYSIEELIDEVKSSSSLFYDGGGVTITGGEPTQQYEGVYALLRSLKEEGIHTAMETNGTHPQLEKLLPLIDFLIMDLKHYDNKVHSEVTGVGNGIIKENLIKALGLHGNILIRIPLVKGFNSSPKDMEEFIAFFKEQDTSKAAFELLTYHEYGKVKWERCGMAYTMEDAFVEAETLIIYENLFKENRLKIMRT